MQDSLASYDYLHYDNDPTPDNYYGGEPDEHGTNCAGEIAMVKDNNQCGVGVAYECNIGAIKFNLSSTTDMTEAHGLGRQNDYIQVYSNSWGPYNNGFTVGGPHALTKQTLQNGATHVSVSSYTNNDSIHMCCIHNSNNAYMYNINTGKRWQRCDLCVLFGKWWMVL